jgi:hypothetical protein
VPAKWFFIRCTHLLPTSFSAFQTSVARRLNFRSSKPIGGRTKGCPILLLCTFSPEATLRSSVPGFQRNHRKRLAPFFWNPPGFTYVHPHSFTFAPLARASLTQPLSLVPRSLLAPLTHTTRSTTLHSMTFTPFSQYSLMLRSVRPLRSLPIRSLCSLLLAPSSLNDRYATLHSIIHSLRSLHDYSVSTPFLYPHFATLRSCPSDTQRGPVAHAIP